MQEADADLEETQDVIERIRKQATRLAQHFCENEKTFNLDEFLSTFRQFCEKVKACQQVCLRVTLLYQYLRMLFLYLDYLGQTSYHQT